MENDKEERKWKVLRSEYLFRRPWLTVRRERIACPAEARFPNITCWNIPIGSIRSPAHARENSFSCVSTGGDSTGLASSCAPGVRDPQDATPEAAARRELLEETGFGGGQWSELMVVSANPSTQTNLTHCFVATDVERISEQHLESTEDLTVHLLTPEQVRDLLLGDRIKQALHAAPLWRYFAENRLL